MNFPSILSLLNPHSFSSTKNTTKKQSLCQEETLQPKPCEYVSLKTSLRCQNTSYGQPFCEFHVNYIRIIKQRGLLTKHILDPGYAGFVVNKYCLSNLILHFDFSKNESAKKKPCPLTNFECIYFGENDTDYPLRYYSFILIMLIYRNAGIYTKKELIRLTKAAMEKEKQSINAAKAILFEQYQELLKKNGKKIEEYPYKLSKDKAREVRKNFRRQNLSIFGITRSMKRSIIDAKTKLLLKKYYAEYNNFTLRVVPIKLTPRLYLASKRDLSTNQLLNEPLPRLRSGTLKNACQAAKRKCTTCAGCHLDANNRITWSKRSAFVPIVNIKKEAVDPIIKQEPKF